MRLEEQTPMPAADRFSAMYASALPMVYGFISLRVGGNRSLVISELVNNFSMSSRTTDVNNAGAARDAAQAVVTAAEAVTDTLTGCP